MTTDPQHPGAGSSPKTAHGAVATSDPGRDKGHAHAHGEGDGHGHGVAADADRRWLAIAQWFIVGFMAMSWAAVSARGTSSPAHPGGDAAGHGAFVQQSPFEFGQRRPRSAPIVLSRWWCRCAQQKIAALRHARPGPR